MVFLLNLALALMVLVGALFLGTVALKLLKDDCKKDNNSEKKE